MTIDLQAEPKVGPPRRFSKPPWLSSRKVMWAGLIIAFFALPFLSAPGKLIRDTRDPLWFNPGVYLSRGWALWQSNPYLGQQQHDGILVPMAVVVWLLRSIGLPIWVVERLWHGLLLFTTAGTTVLLMDEFHGRKTVIAPLAAALAYTLTPFVVGYGLELTPVLLPYTLLPLLLLITARGAGRRGLFWPALFGLVTLLMGGGNAAPQIYALLAVITLLAWLVFIQHTVDLRQGLKFAGWSLLFFVALNAWWLLLQGSPEVFNALKFSEQPPVINVTSSPSEALRGLGFWAFYGGNEFGPWLAPARPYITYPVIVVTGLAIPVAALLSAWLVRWRYRLYFLLAAVLATFISVGIFPPSHPSPFGRALLFVYAHIRGAAGLRTTYKITPELNLSVAILAGVGLEALWTAARRVRRATMARGAALASAVVILGANGYPFWSGGLYNPERGTGRVPAYWQQALRALDARDVRYRAFFAPSAYWTTYTWGSIKEGVVSTDPNLSAANPWLVPIDQRYGSNLEAAIERPYLSGGSAAGTTQLLRYLGVRDVVLQNDLDSRRSQTASSSQLQTLLQDPGLRPSLTFGKPGQNVAPGPPATSGGSGDVKASPVPSAPPVQVLSVQDPAPIVRAEAPAPVVLSGDGFGIANAAREGLLPQGAPVLYSGALAAESLRQLLSEGSVSFIVTDTNRRAVRRFSSPRSPPSYTLPAGQTIGGSPIGYLLFGDRVSTQSVAVYPGLSAITASSYGSVFGSGPEYRPANAFDGNPSTWWSVGSGSSPAGAWIQATFDSPMRLAQITVAQPAAWWLREVRGVRLTFSDGSSVPALLARGRDVAIHFAPRVTTSIRITLTNVSGQPVPGGKSGAAFSEVRIPGLHPSEVIRAPTDLFDAATQLPGAMGRLAAVPFAYLFHRARSSYPGGPDEDVRIARRFEVSGTRAFALTGTVHFDRSVSDAQLAAALLPAGPVTVTASSRFFGKPEFWGGAAMDGDPSTEWVASTTAPQSLSIRFPPHMIDHVVVHTDPAHNRTAITRMRARFSNGTAVTAAASNPSHGEITFRFARRKVSGVTLEVIGLGRRPAGGLKAFGVGEVDIPGTASLPAGPHTPARCTAKAVTVDGNVVSVRPTGTIGDLLAGKEVPLASCQGQPIELSSGWHTILAEGAVQADTLTLSTGSLGTTALHPTLPRITAVPGWNDRMEIGVDHANGPYYLVIGQNWDPYWHASIGGHDLGPPMLLDGYSAGWRINQKGSYAISVRYGRQGLYTLGLVVTGMALLFACCVVGVGWARTKRE